MKNNRKGFTLAELLIVVAIIAVLVSVAIPVFTTHLEKAREAADLSNIRAAYAEVTAEALVNDTSLDIKREVSLKQMQNGWQTGGSELFVGDINVKAMAPTGEGSVVVSWIPTLGDKLGHIVIIIDGTALSAKPNPGTNAGEGTEAGGE